MKCEVCGKDEVLPFRCAYCKRYFCVDHRLPENHHCSELWMARPPTEAPPTRREKPAFKPWFRRSYNHYYEPETRHFRFSRIEIRHLAIGMILVLLVGLSLTGFFNLPPNFLLISAAIFAASFIVHELAHKLLAQSYGLWAEFRVDLFGALITLISIFSPFKIIAPGAVIISGMASQKIVGRVAVIGPLTNLTLGILLLASSYMTRSFLWSQVFSAGAYINALLAAFNLIPIGIFDGRKVFLWSKPIWLLAFIASVGTLIFIWLF